MLYLSSRVLLTAFCLAAAGTAVPAHAELKQIDHARVPAVPPASIYRLNSGDVPGWTVTGIAVSRAEGKTFASPGRAGPHSAGQ